MLVSVGVLLFILFLLSWIGCCASVGWAVVGLMFANLLCGACGVGVVSVPLEPLASNGILICVCWHPPSGNHQLLVL